MPTCYVLIGIPGSGKSTWTNTEKTFGDVILSTDNYIEDHAKREGKTYSEVWNNGLYKLAETALEYDLTAAVAEGKVNIFWDQTNLKARKRRDIIARVKPHGYRMVAVDFHADWETIRERALARHETGKIIPISIITSMRNSYEAPSLAEGFDEIITVNT